jgi:UDP-N-acetylmuramoyl-tripeptide--D-alanyl-D-alanine ligase
LLSREADQRSAVVELGMNHRGEIARLAAIALPDVAVITNVGTAHIEHLGSRDEIAREKGDLVAALLSSGTAVLNQDDEQVLAQAQRVAGSVITFGRSDGADVTARDVRFQDGAFEFLLTTPSGSQPLCVRGLAETTVINSLAAATAAMAAGASLEDVASGLRSHDHVPGRMACRTLSGGAQLIDDTYNANPQSMRNALESLAQLKGEGRAIAVLGDMGELGDAADEAHRETGRLVAELGIDFLFALGERGRGVAEGARSCGMDAGHVHIEAEHEEVGQTIAKMLGRHDWVLVKGSRAMRMERVIDALVAEENH